LAETKLNHRLIDAWHRAGLDRRDDCHLRFVGNLPASDFGQAMRDRIKGGAGDPIAITGFVDPGVYQGYLEACDLAVQLRASSRGEFPASAMDCLANGVPLIVNRHGALAEIPAGCALHLLDQFSDDQLAASLRQLLDDEAA